MKPTIANIDKEDIRWSLSWQPDGRCDRFTKEAILASAPPTSGVYGLFNNDCQVFIGESENIQEALLRHESETDFHSEHLKPTGFTFEPCAEEFRTVRADELIAKFCPVLQTDAGLSDTSSSSADPTVSEMLLDREMVEPAADHLEFPVQERDQSPKAHRGFHFKRIHGIALAATLGACAVGALYLGFPNTNNDQDRVEGTGELLVARNSISQPFTSGRSGIASKSEKSPSVEKTGARTKPSAEPTKPAVRASISAANDGVRPVAKDARGEDKAGAEAPLQSTKANPIAHTPENGNLRKKWSVQVAAAPAKDLADTLAQQLTAKGYDGYVVQANVNGQTYYRVRVGHFDGRQEAESVRQSLARQEGYQDAYLAGD